MSETGCLTRLLLAFLAAALAPALLCGGLAFEGYSPHAAPAFGGLAFVVSFAYVFFLGIPAFALGWYLKAIRWWTTFLVSFVIGAAPYAIFIGLSGGASAGWVDYLRGIITTGLFGMTGGLAFWLVWRLWIEPHLPDQVG